MMPNFNWLRNSSARVKRPRLLERVLTDFCADLPYARAMDKVVEHYGIVIAERTLRRVTMRHAVQIHKYSQGAPAGLSQCIDR